MEVDVLVTTSLPALRAKGPFLSGTLSGTASLSKNCCPMFCWMPVQL